MGEISYTRHKLFEYLDGQDPSAIKNGERCREEAHLKLKLPKVEE